MAGIFNSALQTLIESNRRMNKAFDLAQKSFDSLQKSFDDMRLKERLQPVTERTERFVTKFKDTVSDIKDSLSDFKLTVPFDVKTMSWEYGVENGCLSVTLWTTDENSASQSTSSHRVLLPDTCDVTSIRSSLDEKNGVLNIVVPKVNAAKEIARDAKAAAQDGLEYAWEQLKKAADEFADMMNREDVKGHCTDTEAKRDKACNVKHVQKRKFSRDSNGRFARVDK